MLKEPLIHEARLNLLLAALHQTITLCLKQLVEAAGPDLADAGAVGSLLDIHSVWVAQKVLDLWRRRLRDTK